MKFKDLEKLVKQSKKNSWQKKIVPSQKDFDNNPELKDLYLKFVEDLASTVTMYFHMRDKKQGTPVFDQLLMKATSHYDRTIAGYKKIMDLKKKNGRL